MALLDFYQGTTKKFDGQVLYNGINPDITDDNILFIVKKNHDDLDSQAIISANADVSSSGSTGIWKIDLTPEITDVTPGNYYYEIVWTKEDGEIYVIDGGIVGIKDKLSD